MQSVKQHVRRILETTTRVTSIRVRISNTHTCHTHALETLQNCEGNHRWRSLFVSTCAHFKFRTKYLHHFCIFFSVT